jgi:phosphomannomutase
VPLRTVVGRNLLSDDMRAHNAIFGAEMSSHMIYGDIAYADATTFSLLLILDLLTASGKPFSQLVQEFEKYAPYERNYLVPNPDAAIRAIEAAFPDAAKDYLDGVTLEFDNSWLVIRKSNTEPLLRLRGEGDSQAAIEGRFKTAERIIFQQGGTIHYH